MPLTNAPRVFALEPTKHPLANAPDFGKLMYIMPRDRPSIWNEDYEFTAIEELSNSEFDPIIDFILIAGCVCAITAVIAQVSVEYGPFNALVFDSRAHAYKVRKMSSDPVILTK